MLKKKSKPYFLKIGTASSTCLVWLSIWSCTEDIKTLANLIDKKEESEQTDVPSDAHSVLKKSNDITVDIDKISESATPTRSLPLTKSQRDYLDKAAIVLALEENDRKMVIAGRDSALDLYMLSDNGNFVHLDRFSDKNNKAITNISQALISKVGNENILIVGTNGDGKSINPALSKWKIVDNQLFYEGTTVYFKDNKMVISDFLSLSSIELKQKKLILASSSQGILQPIEIFSSLGIIHSKSLPQSNPIYIHSSIYDHVVLQTEDKNHVFFSSSVGGGSISKVLLDENGNFSSENRQTIPLQGTHLIDIVRIAKQPHIVALGNGSIDILKINPQNGALTLISQFRDTGQENVRLQSVNFSYVTYAKSELMHTKNEPILVVFSGEEAVIEFFNLKKDGKIEYIHTYPYGELFQTGLIGAFDVFGKFSSDETLVFISKGQEKLFSVSLNIKKILKR